MTAAAVLLLATVAALSIGGLLLNHSRSLLERSNRLLAQQTAEAERQRHAAEENANEAVRQKQVADAMFRDAKRTVDTYLTRVSEEKLLEEPGSCGCGRNSWGWL